MRCKKRGQATALTLQTQLALCGGCRQWPAASLPGFLRDGDACTVIERTRVNAGNYAADNSPASEISVAVVKRLEDDDAKRNAQSIIMAKNLREYMQKVSRAQ